MRSQAVVVAAIAALVGMLLILLAYALGVRNGRSETVGACLAACERQANDRIDDLLARLAIRGLRPAEGGDDQER